MSRIAFYYHVQNIYIYNDNKPLNLCCKVQKNVNKLSYFSVFYRYNKWNLKNLLLFRSASEGSVTTSKDSSKKYMLLKKNQTFSFRSIDSGDSMKVFADEIDFTTNTVAKEEVTKKTVLPYKSGLMGCLRFHQNAGSVHEISRGINSVMKG